MRLNGPSFIARVAGLLLVFLSVTFGAGLQAQVVSHDVV